LHVLKGHNYDPGTAEPVGSEGRLVSECQC